MESFAKAALFVLLIAFILGSAHAAIPQLVSFQGKLTNATTGEPLNGNYQMTFVIYDAPSGGNMMWSETQTVAVASGVFNVYLGSSNALNLPFNVPYWLETRVYNGTDLETLAPRQQLTSAPYAYAGSGWYVVGSTIALISKATSINAGVLLIDNANSVVNITSSGLFGLWSTSNSSSGTAVYGSETSSNGTTYGGYFTVNSSDGSALYAATPNCVFRVTNTGFSLSGTGCNKNAVFNTSTGKEVAFAATESYATELTQSGSGQLSSGTAVIRFGFPFNESLSAKVPVRVIVTPTSECTGLYVSEKSLNGFTVKVAGNGCPGNSTFDWYAIGRRIGFGPGEVGNPNNI